MKAKIVFLIFILLLTAGLTGKAEADVQMGVSIGEDGIKGFYLAIGDYYKVPQPEIVIVKKRKIPDQDLPVVFFLAKKAGVAPKTIIDLRLGGRSWMDITLHFGLSPAIYYVPVKEAKGPPYGKAYGYFKNKPKKKWNTIILNDYEIADFVNLRFMSEYYGYSADEVIKMRAKGKNFITINNEIKKAKKAHKGKSKTASPKIKIKGKSNKGR